MPPWRHEAPDALFHGVFRLPPREAPLRDGPAAATILLRGAAATPRAALGAIPEAPPQRRTATRRGWNQAPVTDPPEAL